MKNRFVFFLASILASFHLFAQHQPMAVEGAHWVVFAVVDDGPGHQAIVVEGDTVFNGISYKNVFRVEITNPTIHLATFLPPYYYGEKTRIGAIRDDVAEGLVYGIAFTPDAWYFDNCDLFDEQLLHNFAIGFGDALDGCLHTANGLPPTFVDSVATEFLFGNDRQVQYTEYGPLLESIGTWQGPFIPIYSFPVPGNPMQLVDYCVGTDEACGLLPTTTNDLVFGPGVDIYPNPAGGRLYIEVKVPFLKETEWLLFDLFGRLVLESQINNTGITTLNTDDLTAGIYFYQMRSGGLIGHSGKLTIAK